MGSISRYRDDEYNGRKDDPQYTLGNQNGNTFQQEVKRGGGYKGGSSSRRSSSMDDKSSNPFASEQGSGQDDESSLDSDTH